MTALNFPASPGVGQVFDRWVWNGTAWVLAPAADTQTSFWYVGGSSADVSVLGATIVGGLTMAVPVRAGRRYRASAEWIAATNTGAAADQFHNFDLDVGQLGSIRAISQSFRAPGTELSPVRISGVWTPTADATVTVSVVAQGVSFYVGSFNRQGFLSVEDVGAA